MRPGWNPARRNRHVGTKAHGHGADNKLTIPESRHDAKIYVERLSSYVTVVRSVAGREIRFFVEPTRPDWFYPCTVDDICGVLTHCSADFLSTFDFLVMRQPTRKQRILSPVWGRAMFAIDIEPYRGSAIILEAQSLGSYGWSKRVGPEQVRELQRLREDGHGIRNTRRGIEISVTPHSLRNTVLYRTLLHELSHHIDYSLCSSDEWDSKTTAMKEDFAHRHAQNFYVSLVSQGHLPFDPIMDDTSLATDGLKRSWFSPP